MIKSYIAGYIVLYIVGMFAAIGCIFQSRHENGTLEKSVSTKLGIITTILKIVFWPISMIYFLYKMCVNCYHHFKTLPWK